MKWHFSDLFSLYINIKVAIQKILKLLLHDTVISFSCFTILCIKSDYVYDDDV